MKMLPMRTRDSPSRRSSHGVTQNPTTLEMKAAAEPLDGLGEESENVGHDHIP
jgi:hypothetical protein